MSHGPALAGLYISKTWSNVMQNQIFRGLFISLFALTLTACVGAVNIADGTIAESKTENTDETIDPKSIIIDDKEPAHPCIATPFSDACGGEEFNDARETICLTERESHRCLAIISAVCTGDIFDLLCVSYQPSFPAQKTACTDKLNSEKCAPTVARICGVDSLDPFCIGAEAYYPAQEIACVGVFLERSGIGGKCAPTIERVCVTDVFNSLCDNIVTKNTRDIKSNCRGINFYRLSRYFCRVSSSFNTLLYARKNACASEPNSERCTLTTTWVCGTDHLDSYCELVESYYPMQKTACASEINSERCAPTIARVCGANPFDVLCTDYKPSFFAQETACASEKNSARCDKPIRRVCIDTPFDAVCQSKNLTPLDLPARTNRFKSAENILPSDYCVVSVFSRNPDTYSANCLGLYPTNIDIKPLNNTNTGMATYAGEVLVSYFESNRSRNITDNINITVNFDNNTLIYVGDLDYVAGYLIGRIPSIASKSFSINGNFTDRGQITGTVEFDSVAGNLIGLIGQDEAFGVFTDGTSDLFNAFAGGFTATRE